MATTKLSRHLSVLNDRAFADFPAAAVSSARPTDIMSTDRNANLETRIVLDAQASRLVFFAQELFATGDKKSVARFAGEESLSIGAKTTVLADDGQLFTTLSTPIKFDTTQAAILVNSLLVKLPDNTVFRLAAYINPAAYAHRADFEALSARVFGSLKVGPRQVNRTAHTETPAVLGSAKKLSIDLPTDFALSTDQKYDFQVFNFHHYRPLGTPGREILTVYVGRHPSYFFREFGFERDDARLLKGNFLGKPVNWLHFANPTKALYVQEQQLDGSVLGPGLTLHVGMVGSTEVAIGELVKVASNISVAR
ncbi:hypothetical protein [Hymenobacter terricola]|uniref:hypothetical protein n=1 Tax=Hymenobacter terricola TaxID=2819236 RepID=UPI001B301C02|nr:hypothetical protein [Hymenobacter terricola]